MGGTSAIGYENEDGSVSYMLEPGGSAGPWDFDRLFDLSERIPTDMMAPSVEDYFSNHRNAEEDCGMRLLLRLDGTGVCRRWGERCELIWRRI